MNDYNFTFTAGEDTYDTSDFIDKLRREKENYAAFAQSQLNYDNEATKSLLQAIDNYGNMIGSTDKYRMSPMGLNTKMKIYGNAGPQLVRVENSRRGPNDVFYSDVDSVARYLINKTLNGVKKITPSSQPTVTDIPYKIGVTVESEAERKKREAEEAKRKKEEEEARKKKEEEEKNKPLENTFEKGSDELLYDSSPVILNGVALDPSEKSIMDATNKLITYQWMDPAMTQSRNARFEEFSKLSPEQHRLLWQQSLGIPDENYELWNQEQIRQGDAAAFYNSLYDYYNQGLNMFLQDPTKKPIGFDDIALARLMYGQTGLSQTDKASFNRNVHHVQRQDGSSYFILPGQLKEGMTNSPTVITLEQDPVSKKLTYKKRYIGTILDDMNSLSSYKNLIQGYLRELQGYQFSKSKAEKEKNGGTISKYQAGGGFADMSAYNMSQILGEQAIGDELGVAEELGVTPAQAHGRMRPVFASGSYAANPNDSMPGTDFGVLDDPLKLSAQDKARLASIALNLGSVVSNAAGFTPASAVSGLLGTLTQAGADFTDDNVTFGDAASNLGLGLVSDAMALVPGAGAASKAAKILKTAAPFMGLYGTVLTMSNMPNYAASLKRVYENGIHNATSEDILEAARGITAATGMLFSGKALLKNLKPKYKAADNKVALQVTKDGKTQDLIFEGDVAAKVKEASAAGKAQEALDNIYGKDFYKAEAAKAVSEAKKWWKPWDRNTSTKNVTKDVMVDKDGNISYIKGTGFEGDNTYKAIKAGDVLIGYDGKPLVHKKGSFKLDAAGNKIPKIDPKTGAPMKDKKGNPVYKTYSKDVPIKATEDTEVSGMPQTLPFKLDKHKITPAHATAKDLTEIESQITNINSKIAAEKTLAEAYKKQYQDLVLAADANPFDSGATLFLDGANKDKAAALDWANIQRRAKGLPDLTATLPNAALLEEIKNIQKEQTTSLLQGIKAKLDGIDTSIKLKINGKDFVIDSHPQVKALTPEEITNLLKLNKQGGVLDLKKCSKFIKKYGR